LTQLYPLDTLNKWVVLGWHEYDTTHFNPLIIKYNIYIELSYLHLKRSAYTSSLEPTFKRI